MLPFNIPQSYIKYHGGWCILSCKWIRSYHSIVLEGITSVKLPMISYETWNFETYKNANAESLGFVMLKV